MTKDKEYDYLIVFIGTQKYYHLRDGFIQNMNLFHPNKKKLIVSLLDYDAPSIVPHENELIIHVPNFPQAIVRLCKFQYIEMAIKHANKCGYTFSYVCFFNANLRFSRNFTIYSKKIIGINHYHWNLLRDVHFFYDKEKEDNGAEYCFQDYIRKYVQAGFIIASVEHINEIIKFVHAAQEIDTKNYIISPYHDETYYNKFYENNQEKFIILNPSNYIELLDHKYLKK
jgi:hypothetical protein